MKIHQRLIKLAILLAVPVLLGTTVAMTQRAATTVHLCVKDNGQLRVMTNNTSSCDPSERPTEWVVGGELTDLQLGQGLIGNREDGTIQLAVDPQLLESCQSCSGGKVYSGFNDGPEDMPTGADAPNHGENLPTIGTLRVPTGKYLVQAKLWFQNFNEGHYILYCKLSEAGASDFDWVEATIRERQRFPITLTMVHEVTATGQLIVGCSDSNEGSSVKWRDLKITALQVPSISNIFIGHD